MSGDFHKPIGVEVFINLVGELGILTAQFFARLVTPPVHFRDIITQIRELGVRSLAIANLTAVFAGMVMAVQFGYSMERFGAKDFVGTVVSLSILRELGPVLTALLVGGRVGAGITAELGSMRVTEQIDAIRILGADPIRRLIVPRVVALTICLPLLTILADVIGVFGGMIVAVGEFGITPILYYRSVMDTILIGDFTGGIGKSVFFGFFIALIACHQGFNTSGGTEGVGQATTRTVVLTSITVLIMDFFLTKFFMMF